jgi:hypothetical protein
MKHYYWAGLLFFFLLPTSAVMACSGGGEPALSEILNRDIFVEATILEVDNVGQNAILRVERYLKGVGTAYLAVVNYTNGFHAVDQRGYDKGCNYGVNYPLFRVGQRGFYGLSSLGDGSYSNAYGYSSVSFPIQDGQISLPIHDEAGYRIETLTIQEFEERVHEILGQSHEFIPNSYDNQQEYPLLRPLYLTTESGRRYVMEVDRQIREIDLSNEAFIISPDGAHHAYYLDENTITFGYCSHWGCSLERTFYSESIEVPRIPAQALAFSPNSNYVATWNESSLGLYLFDNQTGSMYGRQMEVVWLSNHDFRGNLNSGARLVSWSGDSSTLVFVDDVGIWRWHIYSMAEPEFLIPAASLVSADETMIFEQIEFLELSQSGRYLRYGNGSNWRLVDVVSGESFANAVVTPDESNFIYVNSGLPDLGQERSNCTPPFHQSCPFTISHEGKLIEIAWRRDDYVSFYFCDEASSDCESVSFVWAWDRPSYGYNGWSWGWIDDIEFGDFDENFLYAIQQGDYRLELHYDGLNRQETYHPEHYDLSAQLDSPVIYLEWGQAIFYEERS